MSTTGTALIDFDDTFVSSLTGLYEPWQAATAPAPSLLELNEPLAAELGLDVAQLRSSSGVDVLVGNATVPGSAPVAQAYAGHQFGNYSPRLGDGRALLLGEVVDDSGRRRDLHLKGSGRTPFSRGGDGKALVGPMLREYVMGEAMHALGIPTTRALAVLATGETVRRETEMPGAVLVRVAASHLRVGTFQFATATGDVELLRRLADYAIERHHPEARDADEPYLAFYDRVLVAQAELVAQWMLVGFIHGVMNTDNVTISGETIDYGPCAFMDRFDPATVFSSIDHGGRYAYGNQPMIMQWNLARLAEAMLPLLGPDTDAAIANATGVLESFPGHFTRRFDAGMRAKLGLAGLDVDATLADELLGMLHAQAIDMTSAFRSLSSVLRGDVAPARSLFTEPDVFDEWSTRWQATVSERSLAADAVADEMDGVNPAVIPRNHLVEQALDAATAGDLALVDRLVDVLRDPFTDPADDEPLARPAPADARPHVTFCGT